MTANARQSTDKPNRKYILRRVHSIAKWCGEPLRYYRGLTFRECLKTVDGGETIPWGIWTQAELDHVI